MTKKIFPVRVNEALSEIKKTTASPKNFKEAYLLNFDYLDERSQKELREWQRNGTFQGEPLPPLIVKEGKSIFKKL